MRLTIQEYRLAGGTLSRSPVRHLNHPLHVLCFMLFMAAVSICKAQSLEQEKELQSPDGTLLFSFQQKVNEKGEKQLIYRVRYRNKPVVNESVIDIQLDNHISQLALALKTDSQKHWCNDLVLKEDVRSATDTTWAPLYGERDLIPDHYNEMTLKFEKQGDARYKMNLVVRAYNEGIAFRYYFPENPTGVYYRITEESTEFTFPENTQAWYENWAQAPLTLKPLQDWPDECERPLTLKLANGLYACLAEAAMVNYVRTKFTLKKEKPNTVATVLYEPLDLITYFNTPWRVIMVGDQPGNLIEHNYLLLNLNKPSVINNTSWIKPGKIMREMALTNENARACIDFAAEHNLQYILFDWKWYGPAFTFDSDAGKVAIDLDLPGIITYGKEKNVGVWLYVNLQALVKQDFEIFPLYKQWGIEGVKYGFVQVGSHRWTTWLHESVQRAADNELMVNIHDEFRLTGEQRTWPNILTVEGIRGNEEMPDATHNTTLPFTRSIAGAGDYTICYYNKRIKTTHAHQLALGVVFYSPLQTLFWYDRPSDYNNEPEIEFFEKLPTVWNETKVLNGAIGEYITTARRNGDEWFVGTITNNEAREVTIPLTFLPAGKAFTASIYSDEPAVTTRTHVKVTQKKVKHTDTLTFRLLASGGTAIWLRPVDVKKK